MTVGFYLAVSNSSEKWPRFAQAIATLRRDCDVGVGDTAYRIISMCGGEYFKRLLKSQGVSCNCEIRRDEWNKSFHYSKMRSAGKRTSNIWLIEVSKCSEPNKK